VVQAMPFRRLVMAVLAGLFVIAQPVSAQFYSDGYKFLKAVKDKDTDAVFAALDEPGNVVVNSRDITSGETALHIVVQRRDVTWINFLAGRGANPNIADKKGTTPLVLAAQLGFVEGVEALIGAGARVDEANSAGETPLMSAVHNRNLQMLRALLRAGADPDRTDNSGRSARDYARLSTMSTTLLGEIERSEKDDKEEGGAYGPSF